MQNNRVFCNFVKSRLQNHPFLTTFLVSSTKSSTFAPALEICKFFSIAFAIYGVKLLLTHLAEIARWVLFFHNIFAYMRKSSTFVAAIWFFIFVKYTHLAVIARWVFYFTRKASNKMKHFYI